MYIKGWDVVQRSFTLLWLLEYSYKNKTHKPTHGLMFMWCCIKALINCSFGYDTILNVYDLIYKHFLQTNVAYSLILRLSGLILKY